MVGIITTAVRINFHRVGNNFHRGGNDYHHGGNQFPPLAESQGTYAVGCCPASVQWRRQPIFIGVQWRIRGGGGCAPPLRIFDDSYYVTPCPKLRDLGASHARLCLYTVGQTTDVHPPPLEIPASAPGEAETTLGWHRY